MDTNREIIEKLLTEEKRELSNKHLWIWGAGDTAVLYQQGHRTGRGRICN